MAPNDIQSEGGRVASDISGVISLRDLELESLVTRRGKLSLEV